MARRIATVISKNQYASLILLAAIGCWLSTPAFASTPEDEFESKVRPILAQKCFACHTAAASGGLRLDSREAILKGGQRGPAITPGKPEESLLVTAIHYQDNRLKMPPTGELSANEVRAIEDWVRGGAPWPGKPPVSPTGPVISDKQRAFWSFQKPKPPAVPVVKADSWAHNDIDRFILAKLEEKHLTPVADADKRTLIRRATFDLTGLPPSPQEIEQFLADSSTKAYERLIDRLLSTKAYGERWGRMWLDVVRYADTEGSGSDYPARLAYKYRNWVINAFVADMPYNEFVRQQIAGDLLPSTSEPDHWNKTIATGYLAVARRSEEGRVATISDTVDNLGYAFLGLSVACARCHDHKFDPVPTRDYYALFGILNSTKFAETGSEEVRYERDFVYRDPTVTQKKEYVDFQMRLKPLANALMAVRKLTYFDDVLPALEARRMELFKMQPQYESAYAVAEGTAANAHVLPYGDAKHPAEEVERGFLQVLGGQKVKQPAGSGRKELAEWVSDANNPLLARVMVNRLWQGHFGRGIVPTPNDFGTRGLPPSNQDLLDYLATRFVQTGWSVKAMHREMMLSHAYQLSTATTPENSLIDSDNLYLWRFSQHRLDAEEIRDAMLTVSGLLDTSPAEKHPFPPPYEWNYSAHVPFEAVYPNNRRTVYMMVQRIRQNPYLSLFDNPDPNASTGTRTSNITALQSLFFMNGKLPQMCAANMVEQVVKDREPIDSKLETIYLRMYGRQPSAHETKDAKAFLARAQSIFKTKGASPEEARRRSMTEFVSTLFATNEFLFVN